MVYLSLSDLLANFYIECFSKEIDIDAVSYKEVEQYGDDVCKLLKSRGIKAVMILSRSSTDYMFRNYSEFFTEIDDESKVKCNSKIDIDTWISKFRTYIEFDVLKAFMDTDVRSFITLDMEV